MKKEDVKLVLADNGGFIIKYGDYISGNGDLESRRYICKEEIFAEKELQSAIDRMKELVGVK